MGFLKRSGNSGDDAWHDVGAAADVGEGRITLVRLTNRRVLLTRWEGKVVAVDNACPHAAAPLSDGALNRYKLICPDHGYCFDIRTGQILWPADEAYRLRRFEAKEEGGRVHIRLRPA
jgi:nitrite reductase/ring-hydroxylating ferredoxin subunit